MCPQQVPAHVRAGVRSLCGALCVGVSPRGHLQFALWRAVHTSSLQPSLRKAPRVRASVPGHLWGTVPFSRVLHRLRIGGREESAGGHDPDDNF
mmetsp:Transcript_42438/g.79431  ORF Transcript_42438/g.79431 Transcript_42438/m.79431 type:complete len:94 (-) Transcript_42438:50-331(-)